MEYLCLKTLQNQNSSISFKEGKNYTPYVDHYPNCLEFIDETNTKHSITNCMHGWIKYFIRKEDMVDDNEIAELLKETELNLIEI